MAHSASAKKRIRQNDKRRALNRWRKRRVRTAVKEFLELVQHNHVDQAQEKLPGLYKLVDQIAATGTIHKNAANRYKARLTNRLNAARAAKPAAA